VSTARAPASPPHLPGERLRELDRLVEEALRRGEEETLPILGYGEISLVLAWPPPSRGEQRFACKRLPTFPSRERFERYRATLADYVEALEQRGIGVVPTEFRAVEQRRETIAGYVVQPILPADRLGPAVLRDATEAQAQPLIDAVASTAAGAVGPRLGLDAQLSNWVWEGERLTYIDVSTPLIWGPDDRCRLDLEVLVRPFPPPLRWPLRRFVADGIADGYRNLRGVYFDLCGNLIKERLDSWLPTFLEAANRHLDTPLTRAEIERYYRADRRRWAVLLRLRRLDRAWQRRIRRRTYPYLLPGEIER
jgi:hypothetical protein